MMTTATTQTPTYSTEESKQIVRNQHGVPIALHLANRWTPLKIVIWLLIALAGATGWTMLAIVRGEHVNTAWFVIAGVCSYAIGYRFYALYIQRKIMRPDDTNATPAERVNNGVDFDPTNRVVLYGHHFAAIAGAGPLVGPVLAAQMGFLPGTMWIIFGVIIAGGVQDMLVLFYSMRRGGRSLGQMARDEIGKVGGAIALVIVFVMLMIVLAVLAMVCVNALAQSSWGVFSVGCTILIALGMGLWLRFVQPGQISRVSLVGFALLVLAIAGGRWVSQSPLGHYLQLSSTALVWATVIYGFFAAVLPVWLLLTPRDYLSTFMKVGTIVLLVVGILVVRPISQMPPFTNFAFNTAGPVFAGALFPFLFITIACGALSGMHAMVSSGTTPKMIQKESQSRFIGYGGMLMESFVALAALCAAISLNQGVYFAMNTSTASISAISGTSITANSTTTQQADAAAQAVTKLHVNPNGAPVTVQWQVLQPNGTEQTVTGAAALEKVASDVGEKSIVARTGGAPTLAVGMASILHRVPLIGGAGMMGFWYHFAIMFEALFILSAVDAVTRVARFQLSDALGNLIPKFRNPSWRIGSWSTTAVVVLAWGSLLLMGVTDPRGGIQTLYPLFGIANQLISAVALTVITVMVVRKGYLKWVWIPLVPLVFDTATTFTASWQKIFSTDPALGYWKQFFVARAKIDSGTLNTTDLVIQNAVARNTFIQGSLSAIFLVSVAAVIVAALITVVKILKNRILTSSEDPHQESNYFAPTNLFATSLEKKIEAEYAIVGDPALLAGHERIARRERATAAHDNS